MSTAITIVLTAQWMPGRARGRTDHTHAHQGQQGVSMDARPSARADGCGEVAEVSRRLVSMDARPSARADQLASARREIRKSSQWMPGRARGRTNDLRLLNALNGMSQWMPGRARGRTDWRNNSSPTWVRSQWMPGRARGRTEAYEKEVQWWKESQWMPGRARGRTWSRERVSSRTLVSMDARPSARADK